MIQINNSFSGHNYLPYSVGLIQGYVLKYAPNPENYTFLPPIFKRLRIPEAVEALKSAQVLGFSAYVWNIRLSLAIAAELKKINPQVFIVFGGPQVPDRAEEFLRANPFIDAVIHGEGESTFLALLEKHFRGEDWSQLPSVSYIAPDGRYVLNPRAERLKDMNAVPSPFLNGYFNGIISQFPGQKWLALWETNRGCPFSCTFCDWGSATATKVFQFDMERLTQEMEWFAQQEIDFVFCCDANFGIFPRDLEIAQHIAQIKKETGYPQSLSVQNTKNATERAYLVQKTLADAGLNKGVTLSLQSVDKETLKAIKRQNISLNSYQELQRRFTRDRIETYSDMILGLPGETHESFVDGIATIVENGQHNRIQFNNLSILPNAEMGNPEYQKKYGMITVESRIINFHGSLSEDEWYVPEIQQLVVATDSMPKPEWIKTRSYCWMVALAHFDKLLQIPIIILRQLGNVPYRDIFDVLSVSTPEEGPVFGEIRKFFKEKAEDIQQGGPEYCHGKEWLNIWWPADEFILIKLAKEGKLDSFYKEAQGLFESLLKRKGSEFPAGVLEEAVLLNKSLLKTPFSNPDLTLQLQHNVSQIYKHALVGENIPLEDKPHAINIKRSLVTYLTWDDWCREVIWYGNKKGAYLYGNDCIETELEGHY